MENGNKFRPFLSLIRSTKIPKVALTIGLVTSIITTIVGLLIPLLTRELVDGFSLESLSIYLIAIIIAIFILQALTDGLSTYLFGYIGQKIVASLRERMWSKLIRRDKVCGCFHCLEIFHPQEIEEWIADDMGTAICPYCGIDSIIGESSGYPITKEFLQKMCDYWFQSFPLSELEKRE